MKRPLLVALALLATIGFVALGVWQVERRAWKLDLIARVEAGMRAAPVPLEDAGSWRGMDVRGAEYRRVVARGEFLHDRETMVQALTVHGAGFWVLTPLRTAHGMVLVNRGFVPLERRDPATRTAAQAAGPVTVTGLLRASEPKGGFLRTNDPAGDRWYSRDIPAIAAARKLEEISAPCSNPPPRGGGVSRRLTEGEEATTSVGESSPSVALRAPPPPGGGGLSATPASECRSAPMQIAPFFIDADAAPNPGGYPIGGLTVLRFNNNHLVYALTWFALAAISAAAAFLLLRGPRKP